MNRLIKSLILLSIASTLLIACSPEKTPESVYIDTKPHQLSIGVTSVYFGANTNLSSDVSVTADNAG